MHLGVYGYVFVSLTSSLYTGWGYYYISNALHAHNMVQERVSKVMHDTNTFFYVIPLFLMDLRIS